MSSVWFLYSLYPAARLSKCMDSMDSTGVSNVYHKHTVIRLQVEEFIAQLGIRSMSVDAGSAEKQAPAKRKLKTAKVQHDEQSAAEKSSERSRKSDSETKKKSKMLQHNEVTSTTTKAVDWIANYQPRKYLLIKPAGKWYSERVSHSSYQYL